MYINQAKDLIKKLFRLQIETGERFSIEIVSGPGLGKSAIIKQAADELAREWGKPVGCKPFFLTTVEPPDVRGFGLPGKDDDGGLIMQFTKAPWMPRKSDPEYGFLFLDEFGQAQSDVAKPAAELLLNGRVGESVLPITWMVIAASNREKDRSGIHKSLAFIENRKMRIEIQPHVDSWVEWAESIERDSAGNIVRDCINPWAIAFAKFKPALVFADSVPDKAGPFCTPRTLCKVAHLIGQLPMELFMEAAGGYMGQGAAAEFVAFLRVAEQLPKFDEIVADPEKCRLPEKDRPDAQYATTQMIAHRVDKKSAVSAFKYLRRMPKEFQVSGLKATLRRCTEMVQTPDFAQWLRDNKDLVMAANVLERK
jgi:hypothetical protein